MTYKQNTIPLDFSWKDCSTFYQIDVTIEKNEQNDILKIFHQPIFSIRNNELPHRFLKQWRRVCYHRPFSSRLSTLRSVVVNRNRNVCWKIALKSNGNFSKEIEEKKNNDVFTKICEANRKVRRERWTNTEYIDKN